MALTQEAGAATGLVVHHDRKSVELLPQPARDKGTVIRKRAAPFALPVISVMTSAIWPPSAPSAS
ncbi:MAG TPA: hypothetical protein VFO01_03470 [Trebonia sp.]|nr:hypothetical protein [Trebonia sp.]